MRTIENINDEVKKASWDYLLSKFVPEENRGYIKKTSTKKREFQNRLWKELCTQKMEGLERVYKEIYGTSLEEVETFPTFLSLGYPKGCEPVASSLNTIQETIDYKRNQLENARKDAELKAEQEAQKKQEEIRQKAEQEKNKLEEEKLKVEILKLRHQISIVDFSVLRGDAFTLLSEVDDLLACSEFKKDKDLIKFKIEIETLQAQIVDAEKQAKTAQEKSEKQPLEVLLETTRNNFSTLSNQCNTTKITYSAHLERIKPKVLQIDQTLKELKRATLDYLKKYNDSYEIQNNSIQAQRERRREIKMHDVSVEEQLDEMKKDVEQNKAEITNNIKFIETIVFHEKDTPHTKSKKIAQIQWISVKKDGYSKNIDKNAKDLEIIVKESENYKKSLQEIDSASHHFKELKSTRQRVKENCVIRLKNVRDLTEERTKKYMSGFWPTPKSKEKYKKAVNFQGKIAYLEISFSEAFKESNHVSLQASIALLKEVINGIKENEFKIYQETASVGLFCCKSITPGDRNYFKDVEENLQQVEAELSESFKV